MAKLIAENKWKGRTLLFGAMATSQATRTCRDCPMLVVHGTRDTLNPIERVRNDVDGSSATLEEVVDGGHALAFSDSEMKRLVNKARRISARISATSKKAPAPNPFAMLQAIQKRRTN